MTRLRNGHGRHTKPVEIITYEGQLAAKVSLGNRKSTYISLADIEILQDHSFYAHESSDGQFVARSSQTKGYLHRILMNPMADQEIDHVNAKPMDNTRGNLRPCSTRQNNLAKEQGNVQGFYGVHCSRKPSIVRNIGQFSWSGRETITHGIYKAVNPKGGLEGRLTSAGDAAKLRDELMIDEYHHAESEAEEFHPYCFIKWNDDSNPLVSEYVTEMDDWLWNEKNDAAMKATEILESHKKWQA